jgi:SagB-type dehydrogenase family enzyme
MQAMNSKTTPQPPPGTSNEEETVRWYHRLTKHHFHAFAPGPGRMDWASQPEAFRRYQGAPVIQLAPPKTAPGPPYRALYDQHRPELPVNAETISSLFYHSLAISAWKQRSGACWALRVNPSSGNRHPLEAYLAIGRTAGLDDQSAIYHYSPPDHALERLQRLGAGTWDQLAAGLPEGAFLVGLTAIHWRCSWKYGERAWRYCRLDAGHALASLRFAAAALGWRLQLLDGPHQQMLDLFGLKRQETLPAQERETPELLAAVLPGPDRTGPLKPLSDEALTLVASGRWEGRLEYLESGRHRDWPAIDTVELACSAPRKTLAPPPYAGDRGPSGTDAAENTDDNGDSAPAFEMIRRRRSATGMNRQGRMDVAPFYRMLGRLLPSRCKSPWDALGAEPLVDLHLMVHRVEGLGQGLYTLVRRPGGREELAAAMNPEFSWQRPEGCPRWLPLFLNLPMDLTDLSEGLSCGQEMVGNAMFSLGMTADLEAALERFGAPVYRRLYQEAGMIGQVFYLEAEAVGARGCGIGCYFDDGVHKLLGSDKDKGPQSLYHFVVGQDVEERGFELLPPYPAPEAG